MSLIRLAKIRNFPLPPCQGGYSDGGNIHQCDFSGGQIANDRSKCPLNRQTTAQIFLAQV